MNRYTFSILAAGVVLLAGTSENHAQRGGRGGGGGRPGGFTAPARPAPAAPAPAVSSAGRSGVGPSGGTWQSGQKSGSVTTKGGSTVDYKGAGVGGTTAGGVSGGKAVGGVQVTTPGGQTVNKVGRGAAATGPGGVTAGNKGSITHTYGAYGTGTSASRGAAAVGPGGAVGVRTGAAVTPRGTYYRSAAAVTGQGAYVRTACAPYHSCFTRNWVAQYPGAWLAAGWVASSAWNAVAYSSVSSSCGYPAEPVSYDYGSSVVYQDDTVYVNGDSVGSAEQYAQQATTIAEAGQQVQPAKDDEWLPLGVFAMVQGEEQTSNNIFQLAINKNGVIRGNYYNALTDTDEPVYGSVDKNTQRAAWTVADRKKPVYEAGIANLTTNQTTMMVHYGKDRSQQFTLFRIEQPPEGEGKKDK